MSAYENGFLMGSIIFSASSILTVSLGYYAFLHRIKLLENCNYHYINFNKYISNLKPVTVMETIKLKSNTIYHIKLYYLFCIRSQVSSALTKKNKILIASLLGNL